MSTHIKKSLSPDKNITLNLSLDNVIVNINQAIPFALIVNELLTNCYKHAFNNKKSGTINLSLKLKKDSILLEVADNGIGLQDGFTLENPDTLGVTLLKTLSSQLKGDLKFSSDKQGAKFLLSFKKIEQIKGASSNI